MKSESTEIKEWDDYWRKERKTRVFYNLVASFYRNYIIKKNLNRIIYSNFSKGANLLHAGCGGGEVDKDIVRYAKVTAVDFSKYALVSYKKLHNSNVETILSDIRKIPLKSSFFDGIYNLGVFEHFTEREGIKILVEFKRLLKPDGKVVLFWPPEYGLSVIFFKVLVFITTRILRIKNVKFHPGEINRIKSKKQVSRMIKRSGLQFINFEFGIRDLFTYVIIIAKN